MGNNNYHKKKRRRRKLNYPRIIIALIVLGIIIWRVGFLFSNKSKSNNLNVDDSSTSDAVALEDTTINLTAIGDIMCHGPNYKSAYDSSTDTYDFSPFFKNISKYTSKADLTIGNL